MFLREKQIGSSSYVSLVGTIHADSTTKQRIIESLARKEVVEAHDDLDRLARSAARLAQRSMVVSLLEDDRTPGLNCPTHRRPAAV